MARATMNAEQILALEGWIVSIIRDEAPGSDIHETLMRNRCLNDVTEKFGGD